MKRLARAVLPVLLLCFAAQIAQAAGIVFLIRVGTDSEGNAMFRPATSSDTYLSGLFDLTQSSTALSEVSRYYEQVQLDKAASVQTSVQPDPVYIEVNNSASGSYNDWKGRFSIQGADGQVTTVSSPRVVFALGGDVAKSGNRGLIEQTLVHEIGHGAMAKAMTSSGLPDSPYLSKPHSGGSTTDQQLSFIEGWAEFVGAYFTGRRTIAEDPANSIDSDWYAKNADGSYKSPKDLLATEGYTATVLYKISVAAKDQNAMWKMSQVAARSAPQSMWELLQKTAAAYPELTPVINQTLSETSGGQIQGVAAATQASATYVPPASAAASSGAPAGQDLAAQYAAKRAELAATPWWKFWVTFRLKRELASIESAYARQLDATAAIQPPIAAAADASYTSPGDVAGTAAAPSTTYRGVVDALRSNNDAAARTAMEAHRRANAARNAERRHDPRSER